MGDYYETLGIARDASAEDIKRAFRKKAAELHPDRNKDPKAPEAFKKVNEAYQILSDADKRKRYDQFGAAGVDGNGFGGGQGFEFDFSDMFNGGFESVFGDDNPFGDIFGGTRQARSSRGSDLYIKLDITLEDVVAGPEKQIQYNRKEKCSHCKGLGGEKNETCTTCKGSGRVAQVTRSLFGNIQVMKECVDCSGTGKKVLEKCKICKGESVVDATRVFKIRVPKGVESGMNLRFTGEGNSGKFNTPSGDLFVELHTASHKEFIRQGNNLIRKIQLPVYSYILGDELDVTTFDGVKRIKIPAGTDIGEKLILKDLGIPDLRTKQRGDLVIDVKVKTPVNLSKEEINLFQKLRELDKS